MLVGGVVLAAGELPAQLRRGVSAVEERAIEVRTSRRYRYGEGLGASPEQAKEAARHQLVAGISALIVSREEVEIRETSRGLAEEYRKSSQLLTAMQLDGLEYLELPMPAADRYRYLAFVSEENFQQGLARQRDRIRSKVSQALAAAEQGRLDDALRLGYWAYLLAHTVDSAAVDWPGVQLADARAALAEGLGKLVGQVRFEAEPARQESEGIGIPLRATYDGRPVTIDVSLYTGAGMTFARIREGSGYLELHRMPDEVLAPRQELHLQVLYAYEGRMRQFPEIEALYEVFRDRPLDTWVRVEVVFPFVKEAKPEPKRPADRPTAAPEKPAEWPLPIVILADQPGTRELLDGLQAYQRQGRLRFFTRRPAPGLHELYVAVADEQQVWGIFWVDAEGFVDVRRQRRLTSLQEYAGARQIWILPSQP